jgi:hypothetical protein
MDKVDAQWSGSLPFTLIFNNKTRQRATYEQALSQVELTAALRKFCNFRRQQRLLGNRS